MKRTKQFFLILPLTFLLIDMAFAANKNIYCPITVHCKNTSCTASGSNYNWQFSPLNPPVNVSGSYTLWRATVSNSTAVCSYNQPGAGYVGFTATGLHAKSGADTHWVNNMCESTNYLDCPFTPVQ